MSGSQSRPIFPNFAGLAIFVALCAGLAACSRTDNAKTGQALGQPKAAGAATETVTGETLNAAIRDADAATRDAEQDAAEVGNMAGPVPDKLSADVKAEARVARERGD